MLARATIPDQYHRWNARYGAPVGPRWWFRLTHSRFRQAVLRRQFALPGAVHRALGPFAFQDNSMTRRFEYPWAYFTSEVRPGMKVIDLGAGAAGLQFVLAQEGVDVTSVDPLIKPPGGEDWTFTERDFAKLNRSFGGRVRFIKKLLQEAALPAASFDRIFCISVIEHIPDHAIGPLVDEIARLLKPGGRFVTTIDLFLDVTPFTAKASNDWGTNMDVRSLVERSGLRLRVGEPAELHGFPAFDPARVAARRDEFLCVNDVLTQCLVLERPV